MSVNIHSLYINIARISAKKCTFFIQKQCSPLHCLRKPKDILITQNIEL